MGKRLEGSVVKRIQIVLRDRGFSGTDMEEITFPQGCLVRDISL